jgi:hypothetical protein
VVGSVLGQDPKSVQTLGCERVLELVGAAGRDWVADRTERALRQLLAVIRVGEREEVLVIHVNGSCQTGLVLGPAGPLLNPLSRCPQRPV